MSRDSKEHRVFVACRAAFIAAIVFLVPGVVQGSVLPEKIIFSIDDFSEIVDRPTFESWWHISRQMVFQKDKESEIENIQCPTLHLVCDTFFSRRLHSSFVIERKAKLDPDSLRRYLETLPPKFNRSPENAMFTWDEASSSIRAKKSAVVGRELVVDASVETAEKSLEKLKGADKVNISLVAERTEPVVTPESLARLGIRELVGVGKTNFRGSPKNRIFNINRAIQQFDSLIIAPGEESSFVKNLGEVDGEHGYLPELVIKYNKTEPEFGGGICQVSTTTFRAALNAGLKITARKNHAYPVQYYKPYGMDATIYIPYPDLRFKNNTPGHLMLSPKIEGTELTFYLFGTKDGRTVTLDGPHILESNPDGSMKTTFTQTVIAPDGTELIKDAFPSSYKSPSLFPHPGDEPVYTSKPAGWSEKQWRAYKSARS